jgi:hypothetical protein
LLLPFFFLSFEQTATLSLGDGFPQQLEFDELALVQDGFLGRIATCLANICMAKT